MGLVSVSVVAFGSRQTVLCESVERRRSRFEVLSVPSDRPVALAALTELSRETEESVSTEVLGEIVVDVEPEPGGDPFDLLRGPGFDRRDRSPPDRVGNTEPSIMNLVVNRGVLVANSRTLDIKAGYQFS